MALLYLVARGYHDHIAEFTEYNKIRKDANKLSKKIVIYKQLDFEFIKNSIIFTVLISFSITRSIVSI